MNATIDIETIVPGAYRKPSGALCLPIHHHETGELMGWQTRGTDRTIRYSSGINMKQAAPLQPKRERDSQVVVITEGPTDAISIVEHDAMIGSPIFGCWSASTLPPATWFERNMHNTIIACGDGDKAGKAFNQRVADLAGSAYALRIPDNMDVRALLEASGKQRLETIVARSLMYDPLERKYKLERKQIQRIEGIDIVSLIESAGGRLAAKLTNGERKYYCPLHNDRHDASLTLNVASGDWKCWAGCGKGGPAQFVIAWRGCSYRDAIAFLGRYK